MAVPPVLTPLAPGMFSAVAGGRRELVYVTGPPDDRWAFWNGYVFQSGGETEGTPQPEAFPHVHVAQKLSAPMPAMVIRVLVTPGGQVTKGDVVVLLEAMKMELPVRALSDGTVTAVHCRDGELVQADQVLVETE
jgi:3-methylcrotonyl-CoA carboxylase alpha subunit